MIGVTPTTTTPFARHGDPAQSQWSGFTVIVHSQWETQAVKGVLRIQKLPSNWDSYGSPAPTRKAVDASLMLLWQIIRLGLEDLPVPHVVPVSGGGIQLEWQVGRRELELEVLPDGSAEFLKVEDGDPITEGPLEGWMMPALFGWLSSST